MLAAAGTTSSRARFGLSAFFGKAGISKTDEQLAVQEAEARHAMETAPKNVRKAAMSSMVYAVPGAVFLAEYSRSAATTAACHTCKGSGRLP